MTASLTMDPQQIDFGHLLFDRKRTVLYVSEVAEKLSITERHVIDLIEEGKLQAINVGGGTRNFWRIPTAAYEKFLKARHNLTPAQPEN